LKPSLSNKVGQKSCPLIIDNNYFKFSVICVKFMYKYLALYYPPPLLIQRRSSFLKTFLVYNKRTIVGILFRSIRCWICCIDRNFNNRLNTVWFRRIIRVFDFHGIRDYIYTLWKRVDIFQEESNNAQTRWEYLYLETRLDFMKTCGHLVKFVRSNIAMTDNWVSNIVILPM